jgi:hypothetical protein
VCAPADLVPLPGITADALAAILVDVAALPCA